MWGVKRRFACTSTMLAKPRAHTSWSFPESIPCYMIRGQDKATGLHDMEQRVTMAQTLQGRALELVRRTPLLRRTVNIVGRRRAVIFTRRLATLLPARASILDVGCGTGHITSDLLGRGFKVCGVDVVDSRLVDVPFQTGDARDLSHLDGDWDYVLYCTVLHHIDGQAHRDILSEASRVARKGVILIEDTFRSKPELAGLRLFDSLVNLEFTGHPHSNRTTLQWKALLDATGWSRVQVDEFVKWYGLMPVRHSILLAERNEVG